MPSWMGKLEGDVDYREFLRSKGVELPAMVDDRDPMDDDSGDNESQEGDIAEGTIPAQASTTGDVDPESQALTGTHGQSQAVSHGQSPQESSPVTEKVMEKSQTVMVNESQEESSPVTELRRTKLPKAILATKSAKIPVMINSEPEGVIQKSSVARENLVT